MHIPEGLIKKTVTKRKRLREVVYIFIENEGEERRGRKS